ncbi:MAG: hypothetical protein OK454_10390, partial [Thaumarchaeota archaeon]|nr:hypothetical protein [Nitrososphaerota archaeon]
EGIRGRVERVSEQAEELAVNVIALLIIVAFASVFALWTLDTTNSAAQSDFAVYLAIDLVSFAMISYVYRESKSGDAIREVPLLAGCALLVVLVAAGYLV